MDGWAVRDAAAGSLASRGEVRVAGRALAVGHGGQDSFSAEHVRICARILASDGPLAALGFLNARTRFRFTGVYRVDPPLLRNVHLYDRENPTLNVSGDVSRLDQTYCALVWDDGRPFATADSANDARVAAHAARERVQSYCGVPIRLASGWIWGTLCHFDVRPRVLPRSEIAILELVAPHFAARLADVPSR